VDKFVHVSVVVFLCNLQRLETVTREEARSRITALNEPFKLEILDSISSDNITIYHIGDEWWDLCAGPHLERTGVKLQFVHLICNSVS
jgi:threonyl-tRNA synthetase